MDWLKRVAEIRKTCNVPAPSRNVAIARCRIGEANFELVAISGTLSRAGTVDVPKQSLFKLLDPPPGHFRGFDAEYKLLEEIASRYTHDRDVKGSIELFTERQPCLSCCFVISQFQKTFPNIELNVHDGGVA